MSKITISAADAILEKLSALPKLEPKPDDTLTIQEFIARGSKIISSLRSRGYDFKQIAEVLNREGIKCNPSTVKNYLQRATSGKRKPEKKLPKPKSQEKPTPVTSTATAAQPLPELPARPSGSFEAKKFTEI